MAINLNFDFLDSPITLKNLTSLVIENTQVFTQVVQAIQNYSGSAGFIKIYNDDFRDLKENELVKITDVLGFELNSAAILKTMYQDIETQINDKPESKSEIEFYLNKATKIIEDELLEFELDVESDEIQIQEALKVLGVKIEVMTDTIFERLFEIIQVFKYLKNKKLLILINVGVYLLETEMAQLSEYITLQNMDVLMVDHTRLGGIKEQFVLDEDYILMHENVV